MKLRKLIAISSAFAVAFCSIPNISALAAVAPQGALQRNYYEQAGEGKPIVRVSGPSSSLFSTVEEGYLQFNYSGIAVHDSNTRVIGNDSANGIIYRNTRVALPVSCIETAEYVIGLRYNSTLPEAYPGYGTSIMTNLDKKVAMVTGQNTVTLDKQIENYANNSEFSFSAYNYDGIIAMNSSGEFHAVAVAVRFADGSFIAVERKSGSTVIGQGQLGDNMWLMNYYASPAAFKQSMGSGYKIFALKYVG